MSPTIKPHSPIHSGTQLTRGSETTGIEADKNLSRVQSAVDRLVNASQDQQLQAFEELSQSVLQHFGETCDSTAASKLLSRDLPLPIRGFAAAWLVRCLTMSSAALRFGHTERLAADLFDQAFQHSIHKQIGIHPQQQTFEKLRALEGHLHSVLSEAATLVSVPPNLGKLNNSLQRVLRFLNNKRNLPFLTHLLPASLLNRSRIENLFQSVADYVENTDSDPIYRFNAAVEVCREFEREARAFGTADSEHILAALACQLRSAAEQNFDYSEAGKNPILVFAPINKKYPLERIGATISFRIKVANNGTGPARDLRIDDVATDECLQIETTAAGLGTIQQGDSLSFDIVANVVAYSTGATILAEASWNSPVGRKSETHTFEVLAQRADVDWTLVELTEPYSLEPVASEDDLIGRRSELTRLLRLANSRTVGSAFIFGQKRVGKTSLANAVEESLLSRTDFNWIVVSKGSGDYVGDDAHSTLRTMGEVLAESIIESVPALSDIPPLDFTNGLSPLSRLVDLALAHRDLRILFVLDEFDELPPELFRRTDLATALFQPMRQISNKHGCGFLLVGGESMQQIVNSQGDRLNKFTAIELDYFSKANSWSDFVELIRKPVQHWLSISDAALEALFESCAGNPYFAKLLARQLFADMVDNRYSDASEVDMSTAIHHALSTLTANSFAHFWTDGLAHSPDNAEEIRLTRRSVLIAAGRAFRQGLLADYESIWQEFKRAIGLPVEEQRFRITLQDFVRRKIFEEGEGGSVNPKIPLFRSWLMDGGVGELLEDSQELDYLKSKLREDEELRITDDEVSSLCDRLDSFRYRGRAIDPIAIRRWLDQFDGPREKRLMFRLTSAIRCYGQDAIRAKMREAFGIVMRNMRTVVEPRTRVRSDIIVSPLDDSPAKSGATYCRLFVSENRLSTNSVQTLESLERRSRTKKETQRLVLIDDFSGTGSTIVNGLKQHLELLRRVNSDGIRIIVIALVGFAEARNYIEHYIDQAGLDADVYFCDELGPEHKAFSESSIVFPEAAERELARQIAEAKGVILERRFPLGYKNTQGLIVLSESCPNNTLPIMWSRNVNWIPLFSRV